MKSANKFKIFLISFFHFYFLKRFNKCNNHIQTILQMAKKRNSNLEKELSSMSSTNKNKNNNNNNSNNNSNNVINKKTIKPNPVSSDSSTTPSTSNSMPQQPQQDAEDDDDDDDDDEGFKMIETIKQDENALVNSNFKPLRVPKNDPTAQIQVCNIYNII